jgi:hypothetical protein
VGWPVARLLFIDLGRAGAGWLRGLTVRQGILAGLGLLVAAGLAVAVRLGGWWSVAGDLALNMAASGVVAGAAVASLLASTRRRALHRLLRRQRAETATGDSVGSRGLRNVAAAVAAQLADRRQSGRVVIEAPADSEREAFLAELLRALTGQRVAALHIGERDLAEHEISQVVTDEFRRLLTMSGAADAPLARTIEILAARRRLVIVVDGADEGDRPMSRTSALELARSRLSDLRAIGVPVLAIVEPGATPPELSADRLTLPTGGGHAILGLAASSVRDGTERHRLAAARRLAAVVQERAVHLRTIEKAIAAPDDIPGDVVGRMNRVERRLSDLGSVAFLIGPLWRLSFLGRARRAREEPAACRALRRIGRELLLHDSRYLDLNEWIDACAPSEVADLLSGLDELERLGILRRQHRGRNILLGFVEPELREVVVGVCAADAGLPPGYVAARGRGALIGEGLQRILLAGCRAPEWRRVLSLARDRGALVAVGELSAILSTHVRPHRFEPDVSWLTGTWDRADDRERITFVRRLPATVPPHYTTFLWGRLKPPRFASTSHPVRRVVARHLGATGACSWPVLGPEWTHLVSAAGRGGLAWHQRKGGAWRSYGSALASLCWVLPSVALTSGASGALAMLELLATTVVPGGGTDPDPAPDIGIEISLAEGYKDMAHLALLLEEPLSGVAWALIADLAVHGRSWVSRLLALQAAALAAAADPTMGEPARILCERTRDGHGEHPVVRQYATVLHGTLTGDPADLTSVIHRVVWSDDTEALNEAGSELQQDAAQILAVTTLVLNLVETRIRADGDWLSAQRGRITALVDRRLPTCLDKVLAARSFGRAECVCEMGLCGTAATATGVRPMSTTFAYRCLSRSESTLPRALAVHLRRAARAAPP